MTGIAIQVEADGNSEVWDVEDSWEVVVYPLGRGPFCVPCHLEPEVRDGLLVMRHRLSFETNGLPARVCMVLVNLDGYTVTNYEGETRRYRVDKETGRVDVVAA